MPIYEYYCDACEKKFQLLRRFSQADEPAECPDCHGTSDRRLLSTFACMNKEGSLAGASGCASCSGGSCKGCGH
jgi:putative FmdB family regulatory protein